MDPLQSALDLVDRFGWYVFRIRIGHDEADCDGGTTNCKTINPLDSHWMVTSSNDRSVIEEWDWDTANAYGIDCGKSGIVVADLDPGDTWPWTETRAHTTGRGVHYIYEDLLGLGNRAGVEPWGIDVRADGGMIVGPGSWHPHGEYSVLDDRDPGTAPDELCAAASKTVAVYEEAATLDALEVLDRLAGVYRRMESTEDGQRNDMLNKLAGIAAGLWVRLESKDQVGQLSEYNVQKALLDAVPNDTDPRKSRGTIRSGWEYGLEHPAPDRDGVFRNFHIFETTPILKHIETAAHSRGLPAPSVLANILGLVLLHTDPATTLPPVVGTSASLNLGFALVGESGSTKSTSANLARELLNCPMPTDWVRPLGSGEGIIDAFYRWSPKDIDKPEGPRVLQLALEWDRRCMFMVDEGEMLQKQSQRAGSTLGEFLRTSLTGGLLGATNRKTGAAGDRSVPANTYRLISIVNIHPRHADVLLAGESTGYPQRFLWVPTKDDRLSQDVDDLPDWPGPLEWDQPHTDIGDVTYPEHIAREVRQHNLDRQHGKVPARSGHAMLTRLKIALALALLHGHKAITDQWWELAGQMASVSMGTQDWCMGVMGEEIQKKQNARAKVVARAEDAVVEDRLERAVKAITEKLRRKEGETLSWRDAKPHNRLLTGLETEDIIAALRGQVGIVVEDVDLGKNRTGWKLAYNA